MFLHRRSQRQRPPPGEPPGKLSPVAGAQPTRLRLVAYDEARLEQHEGRDVAELEQHAEGFTNVWIDVEGLGDLDTLRAIGTRYDLHPLTLEDVVTPQRPKVEPYDDYLFVVLRMPRFEGAVATEQLSIVLGDGFLITFADRRTSYFDSVRRRLTHGDSGMRRRRVDYLAYALIDALIDGYFPILERYDDAIDTLEQQILERTSQRPASQIHQIRREVMELRRAIWPLRDVLRILTSEGTPHIEPDTRVFLRDCGDHVFQLLDMIEIHREVTSTLLDLHLSSLSTRMNEIMKVLTIIATIFIPLGFIASLYGMNFDPSVSPYNMPELRWRYGYLYALAVMATMALGMLGYFWVRGWIGEGSRRRRGRSRAESDFAD